MSTRRGWRSPEAVAGHGPSPDAPGHWPSPWGAKMRCTAWRSDCSPSRICSTCSDSSTTFGGEVTRSVGQPSQRGLPFPPGSHLPTHRLPQLVQRVRAPCLTGPRGDGEQATLCGEDGVISQSC